ncbi:hypothetical protein G6F57_000032 [Rhizopus arrhizus]|uniref:Uncharacterized protein n=1 Tax=Rhizopus oryzae TaxID=64495 RepID=A0A9P7BY51_RHIOR|nr:hypothetical protein G6F23_010945 [Rhizopus arrhizus]KAG1429473.1 hypothetical protein G6F58_000029 [Rhizopus delemar]KAG0770374.1 hypothetical protein G6F24_000261 [Rhizopus arrhizus]KAG0797963.1 hypothetical protein G6F21_000100 [Rhizopus arrhizus]KAG0820167.1 hypothetical protein G6F20_000171 [Rhizopus arrhizus]
MTVVSFITNKILSTNNHSPPYYDPWMIEINNLAERIKKDERDKLDKESISRGMKLVLIAVDEYEQGNESIALDIYLTGVDKIMMALPNKTDTKMAIKEKLLILKERIDKDKFGLMSSRDPIKKVMSSTDKDPILQFKQLGQSVVSGSVRLAVLIKQSPIPGNSF